MDRTEPHHVACRLLFENASEPPIIPAPVLVEVDYLVSSRLRTNTPFLELLRSIEIGAVRVEDLVEADYVRIGEILQRFADFDIGFVDAAVLAVVERLNEPALATLDRRHFSVLRPRHVDNLTLLPEL